MAFDLRDMTEVKRFEAMKAGMSAIQRWLSCQYIENTLMNKLWVCPSCFDRALASSKILRCNGLRLASFLGTSLI